MIGDGRKEQIVSGSTGAGASSKGPLEGQGSMSASVSIKRPVVDVCAAEGRIYKRDVKTRNLIDGGAVEAGSRCDTKIRLLDDGDTEDRISNLPRELITSILAWLPIHDVAKTSILSKAWRHIWSRHPYIVLGYQFYSQLFSKEKTSHAEVLRVLDMILSVNTGPILCFHLFIHGAAGKRNISLCLKKLSEKGVRRIVIESLNWQGYLLFSFLFDCVDLTQIRLRNMVLYPPFKPRTFTNLISVRLDITLIPLDMSFGTQLQDLQLVSCGEIEHLDAQFTSGNNLRKLLIYLSSTIEWRWFECTSKLESLSLVLCTENSNIKKVINLIKRISKIPSLHSLFVDGPTLVIFGPDPCILKTQTTKALNLKNLVLNRLGLDNLCQLSNFLCLLRSFPNLQCLFLELEHEGKSLNPTELKIEQYLGSLDHKDMFLCQLEIVKINEVVGSRYVLDFIRLLLASSRSLRLMVLSFSSEVKDPKEKLRIKHEVQHFPRLSVEAKLIWKRTAVGEINALCFWSNNILDTRSVFQKLLFSM